jgi:hypothetical protein
MHCSVLHVIVQCEHEGFFEWYRDVKSYGLSLGHMQDIWTLPVVWLSVGPAFFWRHGDGHWCAAGWCCQWVYWVFFSPSPGSKSAHFEAFDSNCMHWLFHYVVWSPMVRVPCISGAVWTHAPSLTMSLSCTAMSPIPSSYSVNSTVMHRCLPFYWV